MENNSEKKWWVYSVDNMFYVLCVAAISIAGLFLLGEKGSTLASLGIGAIPVVAWGKKILNNP